MRNTLQTDMTMPNRSNCRSCAAPIEWVETKGGSLMPLDVAMSPCRKCRKHGEAEGYEGCPACGGKGELRLSHFATCPNATQHRTGQRQRKDGKCRPGLHRWGDAKAGVAICERCGTAQERGTRSRI